MSTHLYSVIFVCLGNICRSPAAENIFRHQVMEAGLSNAIHIDSAGTHDYHPGKAPDKRMQKTLKKRKIDNSGCARQFTRQDLKDFDLIVTMDRDNHSHVTGLSQSSEQSGKAVPFTHFCERPEHQLEDVPDPYYGGDEGFELVANMLEDGCRQLLEHVQERMAQ